MATPEMIVRTADDEDVELTPEQVEEAVRVAWEAMQSVPKYTDRIHRNPALFDAEYPGN